jgi:hypothetical protein
MKTPDPGVGRGRRVGRMRVSSVTTVKLDATIGDGNCLKV